jgi:hypothetical protein
MVVVVRAKAVKEKAVERWVAGATALAVGATALAAGATGVATVEAGLPAAKAAEEAGD